MVMMITTSVFAISPHSWPGSHPPLCPVGSNDNETLYLSYDGNDPDDGDNGDDDDDIYIMMHVCLSATKNYHFHYRSVKFFFGWF